MAKSGKPKAGVLCVYCGIRPSTSRKGDHVVPRALFVEPLPSDMVTVPACQRCNREKETLDSYLRDSLVSDIAASGNLVARQLLEGKVAKAVARNRSPFFTAAFAGAQRKPIYSPVGIYLGEGIAVPLDDRKIRRQLRFIVKGLYYWVRDQRLPDDYNFEVDRIAPHGIGAVWDRMSGSSEGAGHIGEGVFACRYMFGLEDMAVSYWLLVFYNAVAYGVMSVPPGGIDRIRAKETATSRMLEG